MASRLSTRDMGEMTPEKKAAVQLLQDRGMPVTGDNLSRALTMIYNKSVDYGPDQFETSVDPDTMQPVKVPKQSGSPVKLPDVDNTAAGGTAGDYTQIKRSGSPGTPAAGNAGPMKPFVTGQGRVPDDKTLPDDTPVEGSGADKRVPTTLMATDRSGDSNGLAEWLTMLGLIGGGAAGLRAMKGNEPAIARAATPPVGSTIQMPNLPPRQAQFAGRMNGGIPMDAPPSATYNGPPMVAGPTSSGLIPPPAGVRIQDIPQIPPGVGRERYISGAPDMATEIEDYLTSAGTTADRARGRPGSGAVAQKSGGKLRDRRNNRGD